MAEYGIRTIDNVRANSLYDKYIGWIDEYNSNPEYVSEFIRRVGVKIDKPNAVLSEAPLEFVESAELFMPDWQKAKEIVIPVELRYYALGQAFTRRFIQSNTSRVLDERTKKAIAADQRLVMKKYFGCMLLKAVSGFYCGTGYTPPKYKNNSFDSTHQHYVLSHLGAGDAAWDIGDIRRAKEHILEHGYSSLNLHIYANANTIRDIEGWATWTASGTPTVSSRLTDKLATEGFAQGVSIEGFVLHHEEWVPDDYMLLVSHDEPCVAERVHPNASARGLMLIPGRNSNCQLEDSYYERATGTAVIGKGAGVVLYNTTGAAWANPEGFDFD
ncbi:hypothetical protein LLG96_02085 [bacterium]|nr:hypothetical protein [bacterium]